MSNLIEPKILKGFRDFLPTQEIQRTKLQEKLTTVFRSYGFVPIDTPVLEYSEILLRKSNGETEKQVFRFQDNGGRNVALRFDLTVPFARFVAEHKDELYMPFKRYHMAKVWRGEKPQAGRYREFMQCDFDIVGVDSAASDFEILSLMKDALENLGVTKITIHLSHRGIFNCFLKKENLHEKSEDILRVVDKLAKIGKDTVKEQLCQIAKDANVSTPEEVADRILLFISKKDSFEDTLRQMEELAGGASDDSQRLRDIYAMLESTGIETSFVLDPSITRGLDYYTGVVYETFLDDLPTIGSVCSGGRYDNLTGLYMKDRLPGVGSSIGLDRLIAGLEVLGLISSQNTFAPVAIFCTNVDDMAYYQKLAKDLRKNGIGCDVFPEPKKMGQQYSWAEKKGVQWGILCDNENFRGNSIFTLKNLSTRETFEDCTVSNLLKILLNQK